MIKVIVGNNAFKEAAIVNETSTLRSVLTEKEIDYSRGLVTLDGATLKPGDIDKTFEDFNINDMCYLLCTSKLDNACVNN